MSSSHSVPLPAPQKSFSRIFWRTVLANALFWTIVPFFLMPSLRWDVIEMVAVGQQWLLASEKHPALTSWVANLAFQISGQKSIGIFLVAQLFVVANLYAIWQYARLFLSEGLALLAALSMCCYYYFHYESLLFNNHSIMLTGFAWSQLCLARALRDNRLRDWVGTGCFLALGLYCKLIVGILVLTILVYMVVNPRARQYWKTPGPYLSTITCFLLCFPLLVWLVEHDFFLIFGYAMNVITMINEYAFWGHFLYPIHFLADQWILTLPVVAVLLPVLGTRWKVRPHAVKDPEVRFLAFFIFFPMILEVAICAYNGTKLGSAHGCFLWLMYPVFLLRFLQTRKGMAPFRTCLKWIWSLMFLFAFLYTLFTTLSPYVERKSHTYHFPARTLSEVVTKEWKERYSTPVPYVFGDNARWVLTVYMEDRPVLYHPLWCQEEDLRQKGCVFAWEDARKSDTFPQEMQAAFPALVWLEPLQLAPLTPCETASIRVFVAFLPPNGATEPSTPLPIPHLPDFGK